MKAIFGTAIFATALVIFPVLGHAQAVDIGLHEYTDSCAACHGTMGKGDGPVAGYITRRPADLTTISKRNNGVFPFARVYQVIEGTEEIKGHGTRMMPIWGRLYSMDLQKEIGSRVLEFGTPKDLESYTRGRIVALIGYIYTLQEK